MLAQGVALGWEPDRSHFCQFLTPEGRNPGPDEPSQRDGLSPYEMCFAPWWPKFYCKWAPQPGATPRAIMFRPSGRPPPTQTVTHGCRKDALYPDPRQCNRGAFPNKRHRKRCGFRGRTLNQFRNSLVLLRSGLGLLHTGKLFGRASRSTGEGFYAGFVGFTKFCNQTLNKVSAGLLVMAPTSRQGAQKIF